MVIKANLDKERLQDLYINQKIGAHNISKILNVSKPTVLTYLRLYGIPIRENKMASSLSKLGKTLSKEHVEKIRQGVMGKNKLPDNVSKKYDLVNLATKEQVSQWYIIDGIGMDVIASKLNVSRKIVKKLLRLHNIAINPRNFEIVIPYEQLYQDYIVENLSVTEMTKKYNLERHTIRFKLKELGFPIKPKKCPRGSKHPGWCGGGKIHRGFNWGQSRKLILRRDDFTCQCCGLQQIFNKKKPIGVHHWIAARFYNALTTVEPFYYINMNEVECNCFDNLICLCTNCHSKIERLTNKALVSIGVAKTEKFESLTKAKGLITSEFKKELIQKVRESLKKDLPLCANSPILVAA